MSDVTAILRAIEAGDPHAASQLLPLVYDELRTLAAQKLAQETPGQTLQPTALVHEAYLRLLASPGRDPEEEPHWDSRRHFIAAAAEAMRRILVENARHKKRDKHGGATPHPPRRPRRGTRRAPRGSPSRRRRGRSILPAWGRPAWRPLGWCYLLMRRPRPICPLKSEKITAPRGRR